MVSSLFCMIMNQEIPLVGSKNFSFESLPHPQEEVVPPRWQRTQGLFTFFHGCFILSAESGDQRCPLSKGICRNNCDFGYYYEYIYLKVKRRLQGTDVIKISSHFSNCCPHLHQWLLGGMKEFGNQTYSHCPSPTEWPLFAAAVSQSPPPPSQSAGWPASQAWRPPPTIPCATYQKCPQWEEWTQYPLPPNQK